MSRLFVLSSLLFSVFFAVSAGAACGPEGCAKQPGCGAGPCPMGAAGGVFGVQGDFYFTALINAKEIGLADNQIAELKRRYLDNRKQLDALSDKAQDAQRRLEGLLAAGGATDQQVRDVLAEMDRLNGEMRVNIQKTVDEGQGLLTDAQRSKLWQIVSGAPAAADEKIAS
jgi:Spy/CpxP family protein refolding chaperone